MKTGLIIISFVFTFIPAFSQIFFPAKPGVSAVPAKSQGIRKEAELILWTPVPLTWKNYTISDTIVKRKVGAINITGKAGTTTAITVNFEFKNDAFYYDVRALFSVYKSWVLKEAINDSILLKHEQIHFDITELYARKIRKLLAEYPSPKGNESKIEVLTDSLKRAEKIENNRYDTESVHSTNRVMQKKWEEKIVRGLKETYMYADPKGRNITK